MNLTPARDFKLLLLLFILERREAALKAEEQHNADRQNYEVRRVFMEMGKDFEIYREREFERKVRERARLRELVEARKNKEHHAIQCLRQEYTADMHEAKRDAKEITYIAKSKKDLLSLFSLTHVLM